MPVTAEAKINTARTRTAREVFLVHATFTIRSNLRQVRGMGVPSRGSEDLYKHGDGRYGHATKIRLPGQGLGALRLDHHN